MSLITLTDTVIKEFNISHYRALITIASILQKTGKSFNEAKLNSVIETLGEMEKDIFSKMVEFELISKKWHVSCHINEETFVCKTDASNCESCSQMLNNSNHEITDYYKLKKGAMRELENLTREYALQEYLIGFTNHNFEELVKRKDNIIPFIGSGASVPVGLPSWGQMILRLQDNIEEDFRPPFIKYVKQGNFLKALSYLKEHSLLSTDQIKEMIRDDFDKVPADVLLVKDSNYKDFASISSKTYITTNYDNFLTDYISQIENSVAVPYTWKDIIDTQNLLHENKKRVFHIHGHVQKLDTMIVTVEDYIELYKDQIFKDKLLGVMASNHLLFIGFSFQDEYYKELYTRIISSINGVHYIVLPNVTLEEAKKISQEAPNLRVIGINVKKDENSYYIMSDFIQAIRTLIIHLNN
ncbi:SIR2 family protein [Rossellomorea sp. RS05]|uniref:SIR2 family NAD-dependent protein deacylase n=1 Tax=Rossellomorea sp. RS05 TaxID=3149166 RepID=UPI003221CA33